MTLFFVNVPLVNGLHRALLQSMVPGALQGRVFALRSMIGTSALMTAYLAARSCVDPSFRLLLSDDVPPERRQGLLAEVGRIRGLLDKGLRPDLREQLASQLASVEHPDDPGLIRRYHQQVDLTATQAGLFVANDIEAVGRIIRADRMGTSTLTRHQRMAHLVTYLLSPRFDALRRQLGVAIERG